MRGDWVPQLRVRDLSKAEAHERLHTLLRRHRLDLALAKISYLDLHFEDTERRSTLPPDERKYWPRVINGHVLAYLAKALIAGGNNDHRGGIFTFYEIVHLCQLYAQAQGQELNPEGDLSDVAWFMIRL